MMIPRNLTILVLSASLLSMSLFGCAARESVRHEAAPTFYKGPLTTKSGGFWWAYRFKVSWQPDKAPDFAVDLLLAHTVVQPVLREYEGRVAYWRFHRRAAPDKTGHQFSFMFYSSPDTADEIFRKLGQSKPLGDILEAGIVEKIVADDPATPSRPRVEDFSDPSWSPVLQRNWPSFIMGVSSLWLGLIDEAMAEDSGESQGIHASLDRYRKADARVSSIWYKEGQHAFLHHLNALFGYKPMLIRKEMSF